jgi:hypothetical protein
MNVAEIDADENVDLKREFEVECIPTLLFFRGPLLEKRIEGFGGSRRSVGRSRNFFISPSAAKQAEMEMDTRATPAGDAFSALWDSLEPVLQRHADRYEAMWQLGIIS